MIIIDGKKIREKIKTEIKSRVAKLDFRPELVVIQVGDRPESSLYIKNKIKFGADIGIDVRHIKLSEDISEEVVLEEIKKFNKAMNVRGILVQLPLPAGLDRVKILSAVKLEKDVDGLSQDNQKRFYSNNYQGSVIPATARGILRMLNEYNIDIRGKKCVVIGRSELVGKPTAKLLERAGGLVGVCHRGTVDVSKITREADILVVAIGAPEMIDSKYIKSGQIVIDVGINKIQLPNNISKYTGDVNFNDVKDIVSHISPVPGGVGAVTMAEIFENFIDLAEVKK